MSTEGGHAKTRISVRWLQYIPQAATVQQIGADAVMDLPRATSMALFAHFSAVRIP